MAEDIYKQCTELVEKIEQFQERLSIDQVAGKVQDFYAEMGDRIASHHIYQGKGFSLFRPFMDIILLAGVTFMVYCLFFLHPL